MPRNTIIDGNAYLLAQDETGTEWVQMYHRREMQEIFSAEELAQLAAGEAVVQPLRLGSVRYVDMVAAARPAHARG